MIHCLRELAHDLQRAVVIVTHDPDVARQCDKDVSSGRRQPDPVCIVASKTLASKVFWSQRQQAETLTSRRLFAVRPVSARS